MRILHFIDSLDYGGAETLLMSYIPLLKEHEHIVVTLNGPNVYEKNGYQYIQLNVHHIKGFIKALFALRKIIKKSKVDIVHSHSFWTNIISRLATPSRVRLINHYHFADYDTMKDKPSVRKMILIDRMINRKSLLRIAVSEYISKVLAKTFKKANVSVIPNFINCERKYSHPETTNDVLKIITVGNCNLEKNYVFILEVFKELKGQQITLDIIGGGGLLETYQNEVSRLGLHNVRFLGYVPDARKELLKYDVYLSASVSESFGIAALEGICARLPLILSEIPVYREIAPEGTVFFDPRNKEELIEKLKKFRIPEIDHKDYEKVLDKYSSDSFIEKLNQIYC